MLIAANFKFGRHALLECPDTVPEKNIFKRGHNSYKMVEAIPYTDFKFVSVPIKHA